MPTESWAALIARAEAPAGGSGKLLPPARYRVEVVKIKVGATNNGKDRLSIMLKVLGPTEIGEILWDNLTVSPESPKALGIFFQQFERLGGNLSILEMGGGLEQAAAPIIGRVIDVDLSHNEWPKGSGKVRNQIDRYVPVVDPSAPLPAVAAAAAAPVAGPPPTTSPRTPF